MRIQLQQIKSEKGDSFVEIIVSLTFVASMLVAVMGIMINNAKLTRQNESSIVGSNYAQQVLNQGRKEIIDQGNYLWDSNDNAILVNNNNLFFGDYSEYTAYNIPSGSVQSSYGFTCPAPSSPFAAGGKCLAFQIPIYPPNNTTHPVPYTWCYSGSYSGSGSTSSCNSNNGIVYNATYSLSPFITSDNVIYDPILPTTIIYCEAVAEADVTWTVNNMKQKAIAREVIDNNSCL